MDDFNILDNDNAVSYTHLMILEGVRCGKSGAEVCSDGGIVKNSNAEVCSKAAVSKASETQPAELTGMA